MKNLAFRCLCLAALLATGLALSACAGTRANAQQADAAAPQRSSMDTPF
jgi:pectin methylesterase-like acyl-CoA thioesterase